MCSLPPVFASIICAGGSPDGAAVFVCGAGHGE